MGPSVVLVEDSPTQVAALRRLFEGLGLPLAAVHQTEAEAKQWLQEHPNSWHLAVVDLILEQGTGMGVISKCRNRPSGAKVVVLSDYATPGIRAHCFKLGADAVFQKAAETDAFIGLVKELAGRLVPENRDETSSR
jgi:CheY-like chemotaxis protein